LAGFGTQEAIIGGQKLGLLPTGSFNLRVPSETAKFVRGGIDAPVLGHIFKELPVTFSGKDATLNISRETVRGVAQAGVEAEVLLGFPASRTALNFSVPAIKTVSGKASDVFAQVKGKGKYFLEKPSLKTQLEAEMLSKKDLQKLFKQDIITIPKKNALKTELTEFNKRFGFRPEKVMVKGKTFTSMRFGEIEKPVFKTETLLPKNARQTLTRELSKFPTKTSVNLDLFFVKNARKTLARELSQFPTKPLFKRTRLPATKKPTKESLEAAFLSDSDLVKRFLTEPSVKTKRVSPGVLDRLKKPTSEQLQSSFLTKKDLARLFSEKEPSFVFKKKPGFFERAKSSLPRIGERGRVGVGTQVQLQKLKPSVFKTPKQIQVPPSSRLFPKQIKGTRIVPLFFLPSAGKEAKRGREQERKGLGLISVPGVKLKDIKKTVPKDLEKFYLRQQQLERTRELETTRLRMGTASSLRFKMAEVPAVKSLQLQIPKSRMITTPKLKFSVRKIPKPKTKKPPLLSVLPPLFKPINKTKGKRGQAYATIVRSKGKSVRVSSKPLTRKSALGLGLRLVDESTPRSGRIVKVKGKPTRSKRLEAELKRSFKFRQPLGRTKLASDSFVEKSNYAIDSKGELQGITLKGIAASKVSSGIRRFLRIGGKKRGRKN